MASFFPLPPPGFAEVAPPSKAPQVTEVQARKLKTNGQTLDYEVDAKGRSVGIHPVDQGMAISLLVRQGSIGSAKDVGNTLHEVEIGAPNTGSDVRDRVMTSYPLRRYVEQQDVSILEIQHEELASGLKVAVSYKNLRTNRNGSAFFGKPQ